MWEMRQRYICKERFEALLTHFTFNPHPPSYLTPHTLHLTPYALHLKPDT